MDTQTQTQTKKPINISEIEIGDVFSEESHYVYLGKSDATHNFKHLESGQVVHLDDAYVSELFQTADQFNDEVEVGVEDKFWTQKQIEDALASVGTGKITLEDAFKLVQDNPIFPIEKGEERVLRGYKVQFSSTNGFYDVVDMDIEDDGKGANLRKVNINEINWLVVDGVKYVVA